MDKKVELDKFYTKKEIVNLCLKTINIDEFNFIIEPSAGNGSFSDNLLRKEHLFIDIEPEGENIIKANFLDFNFDKYKNLKICVIGNPPFGRNGSLALKFIKKASSFADVICFILPKSFKKRSIQDKIPLNFHLVLEKDLPKNSFFYKENEYDVPCVWQIWEKREEAREKDIKRIPKTFKFVRKEDANCSIRRVGINAGKAFVDTDKSKQSHYFIKVNDPELFVKKVNEIKWEHNNTVGPRSISKQELINEIEGV